MYHADGRYRVWRRIGKQITDANVPQRVAHDGGGVMVWAGSAHREFLCILLMVM
jgi:hypothetical protein